MRIQAPSVRVVSEWADVILRVGSLFSGVGGLDLGLERAGMEIVWQSEIDPYCCKVLKKHWPDVPNLGDVTTIKWSDVERADLICGGFPCQPFSTAGKQLGAADERYLWPEVVRCLGVLRPRFALLENVPGLVPAPEFGRVLGDLAELGFDAEWDCVPAAAVGAPHLRYRLFIVAHPQSLSGQDEPRFPSRPALVGALARADGGGESGHPPAGGAELRSSAPASQTDVADADRPRWSIFQGREASTELARFRAVDGAGWWGSEPDLGRMVDGVSPVVDRGRRVSALGNAVVPQVAEFIGSQLLEHLNREAA